MEKIYQINLKGDVIDDLLNLIEVRKVDSSLHVHNDQYYVKIYDVDTSILRINERERFYFSVFNLDHHMLGIFNFKKLSNATIIYYYIEDNNYIQALLEYIQLIIKKMKLHGFTILDTHSLGDTVMNVEIDSKPRLPKTEKSINESTEKTIR